MTHNNSDLNAVWADVVADLLNDSAGDRPALTVVQRAYLQLAQPALIMGNLAVVSTPDAHSQQIVETELGPHIKAALERIFGQQYTLMVTKADAPATSTTSHPPSAQPNAPSKSAAVTAEPPAPAPTPTPKHRPRRTAHPTVPARRHPRPTTEHPVPATPPPPAPANLDVPGEQMPIDLEQLAERHLGSQPGHQTSRRTSHPTVARPQHPAATAEELAEENPATLNKKYTFDTFVIGSSNNFAHSAAFAVAETPGGIYNPLFISGGSGLGKTHLLHAIGNYSLQLQPSLKIKYVSSEEFTNDYINSVRDDRQESFKRRYRHLDLLMVDDIQFLEGKEGTQEEFFHTFNALYEIGSQIVLSSDRSPNELITLDDRLRTRFSSGLYTDIKPPDLETRIAILDKKASIEGYDVDRQVLALIAEQFEQFDTSIRELEGALHRVIAYCSIHRQPMTLEVAENALRDILPNSLDVEITASAIKEIAAEFFNVDLDALIGKAKNQSIVHPRQIAMYLCRELTDLSLPNIGKEFGGRDHTTVMYAHRKIGKAMTENQETYDQIQQLTQRIKSRHRGR